MNVMGNIFRLVVLSFFLSGPVLAADPAQVLLVGGQARTFALHVPDGSPPGGGFPVILAFHGGGMKGAGMARMTGLNAVADKDRFIVIYPDGVDKHWNDGRTTIKNPQDDVSFVAALLDQVQRSYAVNRRRIFATGISNGALFTERLGCDLSSRIAAIASVAGSLPADLVPACRPEKPVAVMQINGMADPIMPYEGGWVEDFGGRGEGGQVTSVAETAAFWGRHNGCTGQSKPVLLPVVVMSDPTRIVRTDYSNCPPVGKVTVLAVRGGGHVWPGNSQSFHPRITGQPSLQINASEVIAHFFLSLPER
ncbi:alpha/beta hydrolase family esterase [Pantoea cypripedii]|uniref:Esterase n=1 Tax=Pantoea cypripedii TaxID=55209 RepID=A0A6B9G5F2_PANCY|nr:PHB depolymerase family esterase [Pantoea cypripedii]QGY32774.1 esterase [Pantoea cypripedii]